MGGIQFSGATMIKANSNKLEEREVSAVANESPWYGITCAMKDGFVISVEDYSEYQRDEENSTPRPPYFAQEA